MANNGHSEADGGGLRVSVPAGWYPDPEMANTQRYWNGTSWTEHRAPGQAQPQKQSMSGGYWLAFLLPIGGLIYGIAKIRVGGERVIAAAIGFQVLWLVVYYQLWA